MVKTITPFSTRAKEGATDAPLGDFVNVDQSITSVADVGFYDENTGKLTGVKASDKVFSSIQTDAAIANTGTIITPSVNPDGTWPLDMTGFNDLFIAVKPTNGGTYQLVAVMGPDSNSFGGLSPVDPAATLRIASDPTNNAFTDLLNDTNETCNADVWTIFSLPSRAKGQKLLQFKITNSSGGISTIQTAFLRVV